MTKANPSWSWTTDLHIASCSVQGHELILEIVQQLQEHAWTQQDVFGVHLSLTEAMVNAIRHGNQDDRDKRVHVICKISSQRCWIQVEDEGPGFNPGDVPDCTLDENLDKPSGRGLKLMRNYMTVIEYNELGNRVVMEKVRESS